jgi:MFS family permease
MRDRLHFLFLNVGHFIDHMATLIFATVAAVALTREWNMTFAELAPYATPGFMAFGLFSVPAGWLGDRWSREGMMAVFFVGIGLATLATAFASTPFELACGLFAIGAFAAIYHPVGLALLMDRYAKAGMAIAINGVWGNLGIACAALWTGILIDLAGWRAAFIVPGLISVGLGIAYAIVFRPEIAAPSPHARAKSAAPPPAQQGRARAGLPLDLIRAAAIVFVIISLVSFVFQTTSFAIPKVFQERLGDIGTSATAIGGLTFAVFALASLAQLAAGSVLDTWGPRKVMMITAGLECVFFALMSGLTNWLAFAATLAFLVTVFGQVPVMDYMIGKLARSEARSLTYGVRYVVGFGVAATTVPMVAYVHATWGFDALFQILAIVAALIFLCVAGLPRTLPGIPVAPEPARA